MPSSTPRVLLVLLLTLAMAGCALHPVSSASRRLDTILAPVKDSLVAADKKPLRFPATVAILMVPSSNRSMIPDTTLRRAAEEMKKELLRHDKYINGVSIIAQEDIRERVTLDTIHDLYGADILVVVSHQQDRRMVQGSFAQFMNLAILPVYMVPSVKVTTTTTVDGKIIHLPSRAIIFRSNGFDERVRWMTPAATEQGNADEETIAGFVAAVADFGRNASAKLDALDKVDMSQAVPLDRVLQEGAPAPAGPRPAGVPAAGATAAATPAAAPEDGWQRVDTYKRSGGGALDGLGLGALLLLGWRLRRR